jgi:preprotein translocase subunit SecE
MNEQAGNPGVGFVDALKMVLAAAALLGGVVIYYWFGEQPVALRVLAVLAGLAAGVAILYWSQPGRSLWVWPTRQETWRTTLVVFIFVLLLGVFFWLVDMLLAWGARHVTGQGG